MKAAGNGELWVMGFGLGKSSINRFNLSTRKMIQRQISIKPYVGSSGVSFAVKGNDIYYADRTTVYRLPFDDSPQLNAASGLEAEEQVCDLNALDDDAVMLYNGLAVHPVTGHVYANTIKGYAQFTRNQIWDLILQPVKKLRQPNMRIIRISRQVSSLCRIITDERMKR